MPPVSALVEQSRQPHPSDVPKRALTEREKIAEKSRKQCETYAGERPGRVVRSNPLLEESEEGMIETPRDIKDKVVNTITGKLVTGEELPMGIYIQRTGQYYNFQIEEAGPLKTNHEEALRENPKAFHRTKRPLTDYIDKTGIGHVDYRMGTRGNQTNSNYEKAKEDRPRFGIVTGQFGGYFEDLANGDGNVERWINVMRNGTGGFKQLWAGASGGYAGRHKTRHSMSAEERVAMARMMKSTEQAKMGLSAKVLMEHGAPSKFDIPYDPVELVIEAQEVSLKRRTPEETITSPRPLTPAEKLSQRVESKLNSNSMPYPRTGYASSPFIDRVGTPASQKPSVMRASSAFSHRPSSMVSTRTTPSGRMSRRTDGTLSRSGAQTERGLERPDSRAANSHPRRPLSSAGAREADRPLLKMELIEKPEVGAWPKQPATVRTQKTPCIFGETGGPFTISGSWDPRRSRSSASLHNWMQATKKERAEAVLPTEMSDAEVLYSQRPHSVCGTARKGLGPQEAKIEAWNEGPKPCKVKLQNLPVEGVEKPSDGVPMEYPVDRSGLGQTYTEQSSEEMIRAFERRMEEEEEAAEKAKGGIPELLADIKLQSERASEEMVTNIQCEGHSRTCACPTCVDLKKRKDRLRGHVKEGNRVIGRAPKRIYRKKEDREVRLKGFK